MCGIIGYVGQRDLSSVLLVGLERLSYRGYDSSGLALLSDGELSPSHWKKAGKIQKLQQHLGDRPLKGQIGIGHTRWATHGLPNDANAHPHFSAESSPARTAIVHNGIIENFLPLKKTLEQAGFVFSSQTDSEVIVHLFDYFARSKSVEDAFLATLEKLQGAYAIALITEKAPDKLFCARRDAPLLIGLGNGEHFVSSDVNALLNHTKRVLDLQDDQWATLTLDEVALKDRQKNPLPKHLRTIATQEKVAEKDGYPHFMLKEIFEQPAVVRQILSAYLKPASSPSTTQATTLAFLPAVHRLPLEKVDRFMIQACGTSWHAGLIAKYWIEKYARIPTEVDLSSEFRYRQILTHGNDFVLALSQSGETADTLAGLREAKSHFMKVISFVNVKESSLAKESDAVVYSQAGTEIGVASTKNYLAQLVTLYLFTLHLAVLKKLLSQAELQEKLKALQQIPALIEQILAPPQVEKIKQLATRYQGKKEFIFIGRGLNYPTALEGALKLKELSYIHATGYAAGELKHGPIALVDQDLPVVCLAPKSDTYHKIVSNIQEVHARKGRVIAVLSEADPQLAALADETLFIPPTSEALSPMLSVVPLQLLSYYISVGLGNDVDQPKNLAKSVTVE